MKDLLLDSAIADCWLVVYKLNLLHQIIWLFQALDIIIAVIVGGGVLGLAKLFPVSFWGFVGFFVVVFAITMVLWINHKRTASARQLSYGHPSTES